MGPLNQSQDLRKYYLWAVLCFIPTLFFYYVGEEGVFTLNSLEMWQQREFMSTVMYGGVGGGGGRPPLYNWLMIPVAYVIGWEHVLVAARIVTVGATLATSFIIGWLAQQLWHDKAVSWTAALLYLTTADVLLYRGWLAYADPLFAMFTVLAIALAWVACVRQSYLMLVAAMLAAFAAFLTKALTVYVFLGASLLVLLLETQHRRFLFAPRSWLVYVFAISLPLLWFKLGTHDVAQHDKMSGDILSKLIIPDIGSYVTRLVSYPAEMFLRLMPASLFVGYFLLRKRGMVFGQDAAVRAAVLMVLLNFLPYWLAPYGGPRYVLPIYPFLALAAAWLVMRQAAPFNIRKWVIGMLLCGTAMHLVAFPIYQREVRGESYVRMADEIVAKYGQYPLYATNVTSVGLSVVANIDSRNLGRPALEWPPEDFTNGIVIARAADDVPGQVLGEVHGNKESVLLICRGAACAAGQ